MRKRVSMPAAGQIRISCSSAKFPKGWKATALPQTLLRSTGNAPAGVRRGSAAHTQGVTPCAHTGTSPCHTMSHPRCFGNGLGCVGEASLNPLKSGEILGRCFSPLSELAWLLRAHIWPFGLAIHFANFLNANENLLLKSVL